MKKTNENLVILITLFAISIVIANVTGLRSREYSATGSCISAPLSWP